MADPTGDDLPAHDPHDLPDEEHLALVVQAVDPEVGLSFWPVPLSVLRCWTPLGDASPAPLAVDQPLLVRPVLERLAQRFPCAPGTPGWEASTCEGVWLVTPPPGLMQDLGAQGVMEALDRIRDLLLAFPGADGTTPAWMYPPVMHCTSDQRPTGKLRVMMDDGLNEVTVELAHQALRAHVDQVAVRCTLTEALDQTIGPGMDLPASGRLRARL